MDKIVNLIVGFGIPSIMLMVAISMTELYGAAAITTALALLGPGGMNWCYHIACNRVCFCYCASSRQKVNF